MGRSPEHDARNAALQTRFSDLNVARAEAVPDEITIPARAKILNLTHETQNLPNSEGAVIHWLGDKSAEKVIVYFHGGGYGLPAFDGHVIFLAECARQMRTKGHATVIALLEYGLAPSKRYPVQFLQSVECLRAVLDAGYQPENIVVGGDSCGGNMAMGLMSILLHPHPGIAPLKLQRPLRGLLLMCGWFGFSSDRPSFKENNANDIHMGPQMHEWADAFCDRKDYNLYNEPVEADATWFQHFPAEKTLNIYGSYEIFKDDCVRMGQILRKAGADVVDVECPMQVHIDCILDAQTGLEAGPMSTKTWQWLEKLFD